MASSTEPPRRLVYGPATYAGYEGIIVDAAAAARLGALARATTLREFVAVMHDGDWERYVAGEGGEEEALAPDDPFDFSAWFSDGNVNEYPADTAWDVASAVVARLVAEDETGLDGIRIGGGSPGGNIDTISGPLGQLALLAEKIDPVLDRFVLERDDTIVDEGMARALFD